MSNRTDLKDVLAAADYYEPRMAAAFVRAVTKLQKQFKVGNVADKIALRSKVTLAVDATLTEVADLLQVIVTKGETIGTEKLEEALD